MCKLYKVYILYNVSSHLHISHYALLMMMMMMMMIVGYS